MQSNLQFEPNLEYGVKLSIIIDTLVNKDTFKLLNPQETDTTVLTLLKTADLQAQTLTTYSEPSFGVTRSFKEVFFSIVECLIQKRLPNSLAYYFEKAGYPQEPQSRKIIISELSKLISNNTLNEMEYLTALTLIKNLPSINIAMNGLCIPSNILNINLTNEKLFTLLKACIDLPNFDYFFQNIDGTYFYEKYINDISNSSKTKSIQERLSFMTYLIELEPVKDKIISYIKTLPDKEKKAFDKIIFSLELDAGLTMKHDEKLIKI